MALKFIGGILAFVTAIAAVSGPQLIFVVGLVGMCIIVAIDSHTKVSRQPVERRPSAARQWTKTLVGGPPKMWEDKAE